MALRRIKNERAPSIFIITKKIIMSNMNMLFKINFYFRLILNLNCIYIENYSA